jgi:hypothetical protein
MWWAQAEEAALLDAVVGVLAEEAALLDAAVGVQAKEAVLLSAAVDTAEGGCAAAGMEASAARCFERRRRWLRCCMPQ